MNLFMIMFFCFVLFFSGLEMSLKTRRFGVVIELGCKRSSVCLFGWFGFLWARGTQELLECGCASVLGWAVSLIRSFNLHVALQLRQPNFSPSSSLFLLASYDVCSSKPPHCPHLLSPSLSSVFFVLVSSWVKG